MTDYAIIVLHAPLMAAGNVAVDIHRYTSRLPTQSMLTGLLANAFGYTHLDPRIGVLQKDLEYAARADRDGYALIDYQTAAISTIRDRSWTRSGRAVERGGGQSQEGVHIRYKHYVSDCVWTVALRVTTMPISAVEQALKYPARPLFIGRKACLPAGRIYRQTVTAPDVLTALKSVSRHDGSDAMIKMQALWPADIDQGDLSRIDRVHDLRDWSNAVFHVGSRKVRVGVISIPGASHAAHGSNPV
jgi:CRISPR system Cascade subunit CasD